jgi:hypothetical protein
MTKARTHTHRAGGLGVRFHIRVHRVDLGLQRGDHLGLGLRVRLRGQELFPGPHGVRLRREQLPVQRRHLGRRRRRRSRGGQRRLQLGSQRLGTARCRRLGRRVRPLRGS